MSKFIWPIAAMVSFATLVGCGTEPPAPTANSATFVQTPTGKLSVLYAGSMTSNMEKEIGPAFAKETGIKFEGEGAGSSLLAQMIRSGQRNPDIFISASPTVNNKILMGTANQNLVKWYVTFARDELVIAYNPHSKYAAALQAANTGHGQWYQVLEQKGFLLGRTDPKLDPKGASTVIMFKLAENYYHQVGLAKQLMGGSIENPAQVYPEESLLAQLSTGQIDAVIAYKHEAVDWKLPYTSLPTSINLGNESKAKLYATVSITTGAGKTTKGSPIVFTVTIPSTTTNERAAESFVRYLVAGAGHTLLMQAGFTSIPPYLTGSKQAVPTSLQSLVK